MPCWILQRSRRSSPQSSHARLLNVHRATIRYEAKGRDDQPLRTELRELAQRYPRYGYLLLHALLKAQGLVINRKRTYRIYCEEGLQVRVRRRKKLTRPRVALAVPQRANERWSEGLCL